MNTKMHGRFGYGDDVCCDDVEERSYAASVLKEWIEKNPSEGILAQTWVDKLVVQIEQTQYSELSGPYSVEETIDMNTISNPKQQVSFNVINSLPSIPGELKEDPIEEGTTILDCRSCNDPDDPVH